MGIEIIFELYDRYLSLEYTQFNWMYSEITAHAIPLVTIFLYFMMLFFLPKIVPKEGFGNPRTSKNPKTLRLWRNFYFVWNMFLCIMSIFMFFGVSIPLFRYVFSHGGLFKGSWSVICNTNREATYLTESKIPIVFWGLLFAISKYLELFDTVLLILKNPGRKIIFLHWVHHWSVLLITWYIGYYRIPVGWFYMIVNALVHSFMYYYYAMTELGYRPTWNFYLTLGQTLQMVFGTALNVIWFYGYWYGNKLGCTCDRGCGQMFIGIGVMYVTYLILFTQFFLEKYGLTSKSEAPKTEAKKKTKKQD